MDELCGGGEEKHEEMNVIQRNDIDGELRKSDST